MLSERARGALLAAALFAVNALVAVRLFYTEYTTEMGSIEAAFISLARYIGDHFPAFHWFPLWYGGIPYQDSYPPLLHVVVAAVAAAGRISPALAYHVVTAMVYALAPVALFWTARRLGAPRANAFAGALLYSLVSPSCWLISWIRTASRGRLGAWRLTTLVKLGEGPHVSSLLLLTVTIGLLHVALRKRRPVWYVAAGLAMASVVLCNWIGGFALALAVGAYLLAFEGAWLRTVGLGCYAYAVAMPWVPPSTIATIRANAPLVGGAFRPNYPVEFAFAAVIVALVWGMKRRQVSPALRFAVLLVAGMAFLNLGSNWFGIRVVPQPERYSLEMDLAFALLVAMIPIPRLTGRTIMLAASVLAIPVMVHQYAQARALIRPLDIHTTVEYRISKWLGQNMPGRRVFAPGTIGYWMDAFSDTPLLTGGFDNGERNTFLQDVNYQIYFGDRIDIALAWLKAFGCDAVIGGDPDSREVYHPYRVPGKLHGLPELWREGADVIYRVPRGTGSLAHAVRTSDLPVERPPAYDTKLLEPYLAALENPALPALGFRWNSPSAATVSGVLKPEYLVSVQVTWDEGWSARVNGESRRVWGDKLGQMLVEPRCSGPCSVELRWDGGTEMRLAQGASFLALAGGSIWILIWRKRLGSTKTN